MSFIGKIGAARLDPEGLLGLPVAIQMVKDGSDPRAIKRATGWERGLDTLWRHEISDPFAESSRIEAYVKPRFGQAVDIRLILLGETLLKAYPEFERLKIYAMYSPQNGTAGYYNPATKGMVVSMGSPSDKFDLQIEGVLLHELQHLIQEVEGFAKGGDPKVMGRLRYQRLAGEVEARNVCIRHFMTDAERREKLRSDTQDVPDSRQIVSGLRLLT